MRKLLLIFSILFIAVVSTACINNLAVQELNNKAKAFADKGDYPQAIERLKSSIDLDSSLVETHYNLAVAYTQTGEYYNAVEEFKKVIKLKPDMADAYYSLATAENNLAVEMEDGNIKLNEDNTFYTPKIDEQSSNSKVSLTDSEKSLVKELYSSAVENYQKYLELDPNSTEKSSVEEQIKKISEKE